MGIDVFLVGSIPLLESIDMDTLSANLAAWLLLLDVSLAVFVLVSDFVVALIYC